MKKTKQTIVVTPENHNSRLDIFVSQELSLSRSQVQKLIDNDQVLINDKLPKKSGDTVKENDVITVLPATKTATKVTAKGSTTTEEVSLEPTVVYEDSEYLVINKPSGLLVHPTMAKEKNSLASWVAKHYPEVKKVGDDPKVRPGIVHRLDKEASGLIVVARTQKMFDHLKSQFKNRQVEKEYIALVHDKVAKDWDEITFPIARSGNADRMAARPVSKGEMNTESTPLEDELDDSAEETSTRTSEEKEARTEFLVEKRFVNFSLLRVTIHTGRMHQIRVHMLAYNHPLVGDPLYFQKKRKRAWDERLGRLFLHSAHLGFTTLDGTKVSYDSELPPELQNFLTQLA